MSIVAEGQASRQGYRSAVVMCAAGQSPQHAGEVQLEWFAPAGRTGAKAIVEDGGWLGSWENLVAEYRKPDSEVPYLLELARWIGSDGAVGRVYVRCCSCPDGLRRRGSVGEARMCKHMVGLQSVMDRVGHVSSARLAGLRQLASSQK